MMDKSNVNESSSNGRRNLQVVDDNVQTTEAPKSGCC
jgi:hypothetical protein